MPSVLLTRVRGPLLAKIEHTSLTDNHRNGDRCLTRNPGKHPMACSNAESRMGIGPGANKQRSRRAARGQMVV